MKISEARNAGDEAEADRLEFESFEVISDAVSAIPDREMAENGDLFLDAGDWWFRSPPK
jgi:hypothetical protein